MAKKSFKCSRCGRKFSMAAHLARHKNAGHGKKAKKPARPKRRKKRAVRATAARGPGRPPSAGSSARAVKELRAYHRKLAAELAAVEAAIKAIR